jgi:hypothetical protein
MSESVSTHKFAPRAVPIPAPFVGFVEDTMISCKVNNQEEAVAIKDLKPGMLVKTGNGSFRPVEKIGYRVFTTPSTSERVAERLYTLKKSNYADLTADLTMTGNRSLLSKNATDVERREMVSVHGRIIVADKHFCVPCLSASNVEPSSLTGDVNLYNFSLKHMDRVMTYGVYANGLLVDCSSTVQMMNPVYTLIQ